MMRTTATRPGDSPAPPMLAGGFAGRRPYRRLSPPRGELEELRESMIEVERSTAPSSGADLPGFLCITPFGLSIRDEIIAAVQELGIAPRPRDRIPGWGRVSAFLYSPRIDEITLEKAWAYQILWEEFYPGVPCERWELASRADYQALRKSKYELRDRFPSLLFPIELPLMKRELRFHAFHLPDEERIGVESAILDGRGS